MEPAKGDTFRNRRTRIAARGVRKVKTGCSTCKMRHVKCDETKPACLQCGAARWTCDFTRLPTSHVSAPCSIPDSPGSLNLMPTTNTPSALASHLDGFHINYFYTVCLPEISLYFEDPSWDTIIVQAAAAEPVLRHAALTIGALGRSRYHPDASPAESATWYALQHYGLAIQALQTHIEAPFQNIELVVLASILFVIIEIHLGKNSKAELHISAACALANSERGSRSSNFAMFSNAASQLQLQVDSFHTFQRQREI